MNGFETLCCQYFWRVRHDEAETMPKMLQGGSECADVVHAHCARSRAGRRADPGPTSAIDILRATELPPVTP
jgi:hypothetical protein